MPKNIQLRKKVGNLKRLLPGISAMMIMGFCMNWPSGAFADVKVLVFVSILPQKYFVEQIGGDLLEVAVLVEPGANPATFAPKPKQMVALAGSKLYFAVGVPFEKVWFKKIAIANPDMQFIYTDKGIEKRYMKAQSFPKEGKQTHHGLKDPHIWLSPPLVKIQANNILKGLLGVDPVHRIIYEANYKKFIKKLDEIDSELRSIFAGKKGLEFIVFHPAWGYFADTYGLKQVPVEIEGKSPKPAQLQHLIEHAKKRGIRVVFVQPQLSTKSAEIIAKSIKGKVVFADPLAYDWIDNMRKQAAQFKSALR